MRVLLDTQAFLWFALNEPQLSSTARALMADSANDILISPASYWEIAIEIRLGRYTLNVPYELSMLRGIWGNGFEILTH
jgi:PIN domain nuclease of toxin-antitoxin system